MNSSFSNVPFVIGFASTPIQSSSRSVYALRKSLLKCMSPSSWSSGASDGKSPYSPPFTPPPMTNATPPEPWSVPEPLSLMRRPNSEKMTTAVSFS